MKTCPIRLPEQRVPHSTLNFLRGCQRSTAAAAQGSTPQRQMANALIVQLLAVLLASAHL